MRVRPRPPRRGAFSPTWRGARDRKAAKENAGFGEGTAETAAGLARARLRFGLGGWGGGALRRGTKRLSWVWAEEILDSLGCGPLHHLAVVQMRKQRSCLWPWTAGTCVLQRQHLRFFKNIQHLQTMHTEYTCGLSFAA
jgi:hypothetical protein